MKFLTNPVWRAVAGITFMLAAASVQATTDHPWAPTTVGLHLVSAHSNQSQAWREFNPGVYLRWSNGATVGTYLNSVNRQSFYLGWTGDWPVARRASLGLTLGAISGYSRPVQPLVVPSLRVGVTERASVRTAIVINPRPGGANALHLSAEWRF